MPTGITSAPKTYHWDNYVQKVESGEVKGWIWGIVEEQYIRPQISGDPSIDYIGHFLNTYFPDRPVERALSLGCGGGNLERGLLLWKAAKHIDAYDNSPVSIETAKSLAAEASLEKNITYQITDINQIALPEKTYDFVVVQMALHHFRELEHVYGQIARSLKPDGVFVFNEFIGPSRFQWTDLQLKLMNEILAVLPEHNHYSSFGKGKISHIDRPTLQAMIDMDASEAVRSDEIISVAKQFFEIIEYKPYGGTLLHILFSHISESFNVEDEQQLALMRLIWLFERTLIEQDVLQPDFAYAVCKPLPALASASTSASASPAHRL